jgi:hypothetical protein
MPTFSATVDAVKKCLGKLGLACPITQNERDESEHGSAYRRCRFTYRPHHGLDIEPSALHRTAFGMMCRTYEGRGGVPSEDLIRSAVTKAAMAR